MRCTFYNYARSIADRMAAGLPDPLLLAIRLYWGWQFVVTGKGKLLNLDKTAGFFADLGLPWPQVNAFMAGSIECIGGWLLLLGLGTRLTAVPLSFTMGVAYLTAHRETVTGIWRDSDAFVTAPPFLFLFAAVLLFTFGPGRYSIDERLRPQPA